MSTSFDEEQRRSEAEDARDEARPDAGAINPDNPDEDGGESRDDGNGARDGTDTDSETSEKRKPIALTRFGGNTDRDPTWGFRKRLFEHGINIGPSIDEIIALERQDCIECRAELKSTDGVLCVGDFSHKGGIGKSTHATADEQMFFDINPVADRTILLSVNTSMTTLDVINGLDKKDFITGKYWTMESLYEFIMANGGDITEFGALNKKLAYRSDPQLPIIPLQPRAKEFGSRESKFSGEQYLVVLRVLKKFFDVIVHDFGTDDDSELTQTAFSQLHALAVLTHSGVATTQMVGYTLEMLRLNYPELLLNTTIVFNQWSKPSPQVTKAIAKEKAGKKPKQPKQTASSKVNSEGDEGGREIQTPGQALEVINEALEVEDPVDPLVVEAEEIVLVGFDEHLKKEDKDRFSNVSQAVQAQFWTKLHRMLRTRVKYEREYLARIKEQFPDGLPEGLVVTRDLQPPPPRKGQPSRKIPVVKSVEEWLQLQEESAATPRSW
jgi:MinD-like ATPase involved in chromosome partitioning or flagellar assembly